MYNSACSVEGFGHAINQAVTGLSFSTDRIRVQFTDDGDRSVDDWRKKLALEVEIGHRIPRHIDVTVMGTDGAISMVVAMDVIYSDSGVIDEDAQTYWVEFERLR